MTSPQTILLHSEVLFVLNTLDKVENKEFQNKFFKAINGAIKIPTGKSIGFVDQVFVPASLVSKYNIKDGQSIAGKAIKAYNKEKATWGWKMLEIVSK